MSVDYYNCDVEGCDRVSVSECGETLIKSKVFKYGEGIICNECSKNIEDYMMEFDEKEDHYFLSKKYFKIKNKKIVLLFNK